MTIPDDAPREIWLQYDPEYDPAFVPPSDVTWCNEQINDSDVRYIRAEAQPAAPERWEPVTETDPPIACDCGQCGRVLYIDEDGALTIEADWGDIQSIQLPTGYGLFRRVEVQP